MKTTIQVEDSTLTELKKLRKNPRQTYNELILDLIQMKTLLKNQYDEFLHVVQQERMKELWENKDDEIWDKV
jgi:predicted CopG family antitoxin